MEKIKEIFTTEATVKLFYVLKAYTLLYLKFHLQLYWCTCMGIINSYVG